MIETYIIPEGQNVTNIKDVKVKFTTIIELPKEQIYSEQDCLNTIASLEKDKENYCAAKDQEIEINNQMLLKIRAINRSINITE